MGLVLLVSRVGEFDAWPVLRAFERRGQGKRVRLGQGGLSGQSEPERGREPE